MARVVLVHADPAEGEHCARLLRKAGYEVELHTFLEGLPALRVLAEKPPDVFVIDLTRRPSHGRAVAIALRQNKRTRPVPLLFASGDPEKVENIRKTIPDGFFSDWTRIGPAVRTAIANAPTNPLVPETMSGYSGTPLAKKLGIGEGSLVALLGAPENFLDTLGELPEGARLVRNARRQCDLVLLFAKSPAELRSRFPAAVRLLSEKGRIWIIWPKKASGLDSGLSQAAIRAFGLDAGFVDYKICAVDETWSGLLFARRKAGRAS